MAERRMFSKRIINSARFLKMPVSTQCLYFHLGLHADDDGIVEAYTVMNSIGATEDDLRVLMSKGFVYVLNDDLVTYITDWKENNKIRADRKINSIYQELLIKVLPDVEILQKKQRSDVKERLTDNQWTTNEQPMDVQLSTNGRSMDGPWTTNGPHRIGKESIVKDNNNTMCNSDESHGANLEKSKPSKAEIDSFFESIWKLYPNKRGKGKITDSKKKQLYAIGYDEMKRAIERYLKGLAVDEWRHPQNGSTFFRSGFIDYLDKNYVEPEKSRQNANMGDIGHNAEPDDLDEYF